MNKNLLLLATTAALAVAVGFTVSNAMHSSGGAPDGGAIGFFKKGQDRLFALVASDDDDRHRQARHDDDDDDDDDDRRGGVSAAPAGTVSTP